MQRRWELELQNVVAGPSRALPPIKLRSGIGFIEKSLQEKQKATDESISIAFQDLSKLMTMAKDMVKLSQIISTKIRVSLIKLFVILVYYVWYCRRNKVT